MNRSKTMRVATALAIASVAVLVSGCGSSSTSIPLTGIGGTASIAGYPGYAGAAGTCIPISQPITFVAQGAMANSANLYMGYLPQGQAGQVLMGQGQQGPYNNIRPNTGQPGVDGLLSMNIVAATQYGGGYGGSYGSSSFTGGTQVNISGVIQIAAATQADIMYQTGSTFSYGGSLSMGYSPIATGYPSYTGITAPGAYGASQLCVSSIAMNAGLSGNLVYDNQTYIYLNGSTHGYVLSL